MKSSLLFVLTLFATAPLFAENTFYLGGGIGRAPETGSMGAGLEPLVDSTKERWRAFAGVDLNRRLGLELTFSDLGDRSCCPGFADFGFSTSVEAQSAAVLIHQPWRRFSLFARAGIHHWQEKGRMITIAGPQPTRSDGTEPLVGAGFTVSLGRGFAARGEWERLRFDDRSTDAWWGSVLYRF